MKSMTGFGRESDRSLHHSSHPSEDGRSGIGLDVSIRTVNGRFFEMRSHLPREYSGFEVELRALVGAGVSRGTLDLHVNRARSTGTDAAEVNVNIVLARKWLEGYRQLGAALKLEAEPTLELLTRIPDVLQVEEREEVTEAEKQTVFKLVSEAMMACDRERRREGQALEAELQRLCAQLEDLVGRMETLKAEANADLERRYRERLQKFGFAGGVDDQRIAQEIVIQLDRADISEELVRLREHVKAYRELLKSQEPQGKKLDFYAQELLREVNTIGSKSHIAKLTSLVVDAKTVVEKIREQVQNVE